MNTQNNILATVEFQKRLSELAFKTNELIIISAYITKKAAQWLVSILPNDCKVTLVARLNSSDIISGSSDLEAIKLALENNWRISRLSELHAKIYLTNNKNLFVGSANCTSNGLKLYGVGNIETSVELEATDDDRRFIQTIIDQSDAIDFETLQRMKEHLSSIKKDNSEKKYKDWPIDIFKQNRTLWVSDCLWSLPEDIKQDKHDMDILGLNISSNLDDISGILHIPKK